MIITSNKLIQCLILGWVICSFLTELNTCQVPLTSYVTLQGTNIAAGKCTGVVIGTGIGTEIGEYPTNQGLFIADGY